MAHCSTGSSMAPATRRRGCLSRRTIRPSGRSTGIRSGTFSPADPRTTTPSSGQSEWHPVHEGLLVSGGGDGSLLYWIVDGAGDKEAGLLEQAHDQAVWTLDWHPLGHILASGSNDNNTKFWCRNKPGDTADDFHCSSGGILTAGSGVPPAGHQHHDAAALRAAQPLTHADEDGGAGGAGVAVGAREAMIPGMGLDDGVLEQLRNEAPPESFVPGLGSTSLLPDDPTQQLNQLGVGAKKTLIKQPPPKKAQRQFERIWNTATAPSASSDAGEGSAGGGGAAEGVAFGDAPLLKPTVSFKKQKGSLLGAAPPPSMMTAARTAPASAPSTQQQTQAASSSAGQNTGLPPPPGPPPPLPPNWPPGMPLPFPPMGMLQPPPGGPFQKLPPPPMMHDSPLPPPAGAQQHMGARPPPPAHQGQLPPRQNAPWRMPSGAPPTDGGDRDYRQPPSSFKPSAGGGDVDFRSQPPSSDMDLRGGRDPRRRQPLVTQMNNDGDGGDNDNAEDLDGRNGSGGGHAFGNPKRKWQQDFEHDEHPPSSSAMPMQQRPPIYGAPGARGGGPPGGRGGGPPQGAGPYIDHQQSNWQRGGGPMKRGRGHEMHGPPPRGGRGGRGRGRGRGGS